MFFGDALLTPAMSVLSAIEGLTVIPELEGRIEALHRAGALGLLIGLFLIQKKGTSVVGKLFGPVCLVWFITLGALGLWHITQDGAQILMAISPHYAVSSCHARRCSASSCSAPSSCASPAPKRSTPTWAISAASRSPRCGHGWSCPRSRSTISVRARWCWPTRKPRSNPFFMMAPESLQIPLVILATLATIVASQAVITGAYSLTQQAVQLGLLPRLRIVNTSASEHGQIYMPQINWMLLAGVVILVLTFKSSSALASAYGVSVIGTMITSSILIFIAARRVWKKKRLAVAVLIVAPFLLVESVFLASNMLKLPSGGYVPLLIAALPDAGDVDLGARHQDPARPHPQGPHCAGRLQGPRGEPAAHRERHGRLPHRRSRTQPPPRSCTTSSTTRCSTSTTSCSTFAPRRCPTCPMRRRSRSSKSSTTSIASR
jgi:KUP system potassium uptake protein